MNLPGPSGYGSKKKLSRTRGLALYFFFYQVFLGTLFHPQVASKGESKYPRLPPGYSGRSGRRYLWKFGAFFLFWGPYLPFLKDEGPFDDLAES